MWKYLLIAGLLSGCVTSEDNLKKKTINLKDFCSDKIMGQNYEIPINGTITEVEVIEVKTDGTVVKSSLTFTLVNDNLLFKCHNHPAGDRTFIIWYE